MTDPLPLDPDEVACPRCQAAAGVVCRKPNGDKADEIHVARRRLAERGGTVNRPRPAVKRTPGKIPPATPEGRSKGGKTTAQARRRRKAELAAQVEAKRQAAEDAAIEAEAAKLADDAARYARDRAVLRRNVLDGASKAYTRLIEGLDGLQRVEVDDEGRPVLAAQEYEDGEGRKKVRMVPDVRGAFSASHVERLAKIALSTLNSLRLEEGKPTGITETHTAGTADALGEAGVADLVKWAASNLPPPAASS